MADFADIGRTDPIGSIQKWQAHESNMKTQSQNRAVNDLSMTQMKQQIDTNQRAMQQKIEQEKKLDMPQPIEVLRMQFEGGGEQGTAGAFALDVARQNGLIDMSQGGEGTITPRGQAQLSKILQNPNMIGKMSRIRINWGRQRLNQAKQMLAKKPDDEKAQAAFQQASTFLTQALGADKAFTTAMQKQIAVKRDERLFDPATGKVTLDAMPEEPKQQDGYTLSPGQKRFEGGEMVSENPPIDKGGAGSGSGMTAYRQWYKDGSSEAMKRIFANKPEKQSEIKIFMDALESGDMDTAQESENKLTQAMTEDQYKMYEDNIKEFFNRQGVPKEIRDMFNKNVGVEPEVELPDPTEYSGKTIKYPNGDRFKSDGSKWEKLNG